VKQRKPSMTQPGIPSIITSFVPRNAAYIHR
jgi:hypothetical protein